ncbi:MAG: hypothetical protein KAU44_07980 [Candidatus Marinimicrobia bacterium]|nr:hypothetical protein [Candidatus Neomarinimicrobiota bacterium]
MKYIIQSFILLILSALSFATPLNIYIEYDILNENEQNGCGVVFYNLYEGMFMQVLEPVNQRVRMNPEEFIYYYPNKNIAMLMNNRNGTLASIPIQLFLNTGSEDLGLSSIGFSLKDHIIRQDTLIKIWELKGKKKREYIHIDVYIHDKQVFKTESYDGNEKLIKKVGYYNWKELDNYSYPMRLRINENEIWIEYNFYNLTKLDTIPDSVYQAFKLPEDCDIYEYTW